MKRLAFCAALLIVGITAAQAQPVVDTPLFDPSSGSYFLLHRFTKAESPDDVFHALNFAQSMRAASGRAHKGVPGRMAVVKTAETHQFILINLRPPEHTWIGLRYFCKLRQLQWVNGEVHPKGAFSPWAAKWDQADTASCVRGGGEADWMPVAYEGVHAGARWVAKGAKKRYSYVIIEFPTGKP